MSNPEVKMQYEGAILQQLIKNAEELAVIKPEVAKITTLEQKIDKIYSTLETIKWIVVTIAIGVVINIFSQPIVSFLF